METISHVVLKFAADYLVVVIVLIGGIALLRVPAEQRYQVLVRAVFAGLVALLLAKTASLFYHGQRPFVAMGATPQIAYLPDPGFPSDHALLVFLTTFVVWASTKYVRLSVLLLVLSIIVGAARIIGLVHTPLDIFGGFACAFVAAWGVYGKRLFARRD